jgi:phosphatidylglycerol:prolipoprotein diacylglycerol transferase
VSFSLQSTTLLASGVLRLGPLRLSAYGVFAAIGLLAALGLSQRTALLAGLRPQSLWDAGFFTATAAFVFSRVLLIMRDPHAFATIPMRILTLPSFTWLGMALTAAATLVYLLRRGLPLLRVLDAWAPCAAVLAAALSLGHFAEGTDTGMSTSLPWGVPSPDPALGRVHPVQLYAFAAALALSAILFHQLRQDPRAGYVAAIALVAGGILSLLLAMLTQPTQPLATGWLEPGQWIAAASVLAGAVLLMFPPQERA